MSLMREIADRIDADKPRVLREAEIVAAEAELRGFSTIRKSARTFERALELAELIADIKEGKRREYWLTETMTVSDFPQLFGFTVERIILDKYAEAPATWDRIANRRLLRDFRNVDIKRRAYGIGGRLVEVPEQSEYPEAALTEQAPIQYKPAKYGRRFSFSFELSIGDVLGELEDIPQEFGRAARLTENYAVTEKYAGATGPLNTLYTAGNKNIVTGNPILNIDGLTTAFNILNSQLDEQGRPIFFEAVTLVVPPALEIPARNLMGADRLEITTAGGTVDNPASGAVGGQRLITANWLKNRLNLVVNPYLPLVSTTNGNTSWYLFADVNAGTGAAIEIGFLRGYEEPQIWVKEPDARRVGGGAVDPMEGDFNFDAIVYRIRHILGTAVIDPKATVASNGTGS